MKRFNFKSGAARIVAVILALAILALGLCACRAESDDAGVVTVVVAADSNVDVFEVNISDVEITEGALSVLKYLKGKGELDFEATESTYGAYLTKVGDVVANDEEFVYVAIYTSVDSDKDVSAYATTVEYEGITLTSSGLGISSMSVKDGAVLYFCEGTY